MDSIETKIPASEKDSSMMKRSSFEAKSLDDKEKKEKDKKKSSILLEVDSPPPEKKAELFDRSEQSIEESVKSIFEVKDKPAITEDDETADTPEAVEAEPSIDKLDEVDEVVVAHTHDADRKDALQTEGATAETGSPEATAVAANLKFVETLDENLDTMPFEEAVEVSADSVIAAINQDGEESAEERLDGVDIAFEEETESDEEEAISGSSASSSSDSVSFFRKQYQHHPSLSSADSSPS